MRAMPLFVFLPLLACGGGGFPCTYNIEGTYRITWDEEAGGTCGAIADQVVFVSPEVPATCEVLNQIDDEATCSRESQVRCEDVGNDLENTAAGTITQTAADGQSYAGTITMSFRRLSTGVSTCTSTYAVTYTKQ